MTKLIRNKKFTRLTALLLVVAVIFGTMFTLPVSAASGDKVTITFDYCYDAYNGYRLCTANKCTGNIGR